MSLDLFKLHSKEDKPKGWIWVKFNPYLLQKEYIKILYKTSQKEISKKINKNLNAGISTIEKHLIKLKKSKEKIEFPLPIIIELTNFINKAYLKKKVIDSMEYFICKTSTTKQRVKAVKEINEIFAKLIGAFIADGHSKPENQSYRLRITDGRKELVIISAKWIKQIFEFNSIIRFNKTDNTYNCWFNNKVIARYLKNILEIPSGKKSYLVQEPDLIKKSSFNLRKAFASGVINFDGGIKTTGMVSISSMSKQLIYDLYTILKLDKIKVNLSYNIKKKSWLLESNSGRNPTYIKRLLTYFEEETWKYNRLKFFIEDKNYSIGQLNYLFPKHYLSKINLNEIYNCIRTIKSGNIDDIIKGLNNSKVSNTTIYKYLYILEKSRLISKTIENCNEVRYNSKWQP
ncbi:MAG: hypothetical protein PHD81_03535 [Candidatus Nanoarchaeia archaeon]|nr:hypothetical protein [Candidatus Nanoarchaeia archaeon]MDD5588156.1 hypothetical protein [Candidatus Nanoarchaeia archaeon]